MLKGDITAPGPPPPQFMSVFSKKTSLDAHYPHPFL